MAPRDAARPMTLTKSTLTPIGSVIAIVGVAIGATWWAASIVNRLERIETAIKESASDTITRRDFDLWLMMFARENPTLKVPERNR